MNNWGASTSGTQYETTTNVVLEKRFDWDGLVDKVFKDEKRKTHYRFLYLRLLKINWIHSVLENQTSKF